MKEKAKKQKKVIIIVAVIFIMIFLLALCSEESDTNASDPATDKQGIKNEEKLPSPPQSPNQVNTPDNTPNDNEVPPEPETPKISKRYKITYSAKLIENNSLGEDWSYGAKFNDSNIASNSTVTAELSAGPTIVVFATEDDASKDDHKSVNVTFSDMAIGTSETKTVIVTVTENDGRYSGHTAKWEFTITCIRI